MKGNGTTKDFNHKNRRSINFGYIIAPQDESRDAFIAKCIREKKVSIQVEDGGGIIHNCKITNEAIKNVIFPNGNLLGSLVCFFTEPFGNNVYVIGTLNKSTESTSLKENVIYESKSSIRGNASISVDGDGVINIDVLGSVNDTGKLNININNIDNSAELNVNVKGGINIYCEGDTNIKNVDGNININADATIAINSSKQVLNEGNEAMLRGNITETNLELEKSAVTGVIDAINNAVAAPGAADGGSALLSSIKAGLAKITSRADYKDIKSKKSFLK